MNIEDLKEKDRLAIVEFRKKIKDFLKGKLHSFILFGSKIRGTDSEDSDIDLFIVVKEYTPQIKDNIIDIAFDVNLSYGVYVSPRVVPLKLFENVLFHSTPFVQHIEKEGIKL